MSTNFLFVIFQGVIFLINAVLLIQAQNQSGFISIDCGISDVSNYTDETTGISYFSDANFTETGENSEITAAYKLQTDEKQFWNVRSFPQGTRNCYTLKPFKGKGERYLIRARFMYGNYDNKGLVPKFDLYIGVDLWDTVVLEEARIIENKEIIHVPKLDYIHVCLVNTGFGVPFISVLELRPLNNETYVSQSETEALQLYQRFDFASTTDQIMRYKDDVYDRLWSPFQAEIWKPINASLEDENSISRNLYASPLAVLSTAYTRNSSIGYMGVIWKKLNSSSKYYFYIHFAELEKLGKNQTREFNIYINGDLWYGPLVPEYFSETTIYSASGHTTDSEGKIVVWINKTENSTLPPLINAMEIYDIKELSQQETNLTDVDAILNIKSVYEVKRNWQGDPCAPKAYSWNGLNCSYDTNNLPRIISLDLSLSGLKGEISPYIAELTMLEYLDLSNNSLTGTLPEFLAQLSFLRVLNLKGNNLKGPLPAALLGRLNNGLSISADASVIGRKVSSPTSESSSSPGYCWFKKNKFVVPMFSLVGGFLLHFVL